MSLRLSKRLNKIIEMCDSADTIIDVGTDHGKVPITLANLKLAKNIIAIDNKKGPLEACKKNASIYINNNDVGFQTLLSEGLEKVDKNIECGIIITGMGYDNMKEILQNVKEYNFKYLLLSPHTKINNLKTFITDMGLTINEDLTVFDDGKNYSIIKVIKGE